MLNQPSLQLKIWHALRRVMMRRAAQFWYVLRHAMMRRAASAIAANPCPA